MAPHEERKKEWGYARHCLLFHRFFLCVFAPLRDKIFQSLALPRLQRSFGHTQLFHRCHLTQ